MNRQACIHHAHHAPDFALIATVLLTCACCVPVWCWAQVFGVESHRLALVLAARGELAKLLSRAILAEMGLVSSKNMKLVNYL